MTPIMTLAARASGAVIGRAQAAAFSGWIACNGLDVECGNAVVRPPLLWKPSRSRLRAAVEGLERLEHLEGQGAPPSAQLGWPMAVRHSFLPPLSKTP